MIIYRLCEDCEGVLEGSCISEGKYKQVYYLHKPLFEPIGEEDKKGMIEYKDETYCLQHGLECLLFYNQKEIDKFTEKINATS